MKVIIVNCLFDGDVVWFGENGVWVECIMLVKIFDGKDVVVDGLV